MRLFLYLCLFFVGGLVVLSLMGIGLFAYCPSYMSTNLTCTDCPTNCGFGGEVMWMSLPIMALGIMTGAVILAVRFAKR